MIFVKTRSNLKYLQDSLFYLAGSQAPYIHVLLSYVVSITWYINQPLVRLLLHIINLQLVWYHLHRSLLCNDLIQFLVRMFSFKSECISPYSISTSSPIKFALFNLVDSSVCNVRIEWLWVDVTAQVGAYWAKFFIQLELQHGLDINNINHI